MSEAALWKYLRDKILPADIHATRIENGVSAGFPDVHYTICGRSGTLELKFLRKKKLPFGDGGLNLDQRLWIRDEVGAGGTVWIIAEVNKIIYVVRGRYADAFNEWTLDEMSRFSSMKIIKGKPLNEARADFAIFL